MSHPVRPGSWMVDARMPLGRLHLEGDDELGLAEEVGDWAAWLVCCIRLAGLVLATARRPMATTPNRDDGRRVCHGESKFNAKPRFEIPVSRYFSESTHPKLVEVLKEDKLQDSTILDDTFRAGLVVSNFRPIVAQLLSSHLVLHALARDRLLGDSMSCTTGLFTLVLTNMDSGGGAAKLLNSDRS